MRDLIAMASLVVVLGGCAAPAAIASTDRVNHVEDTRPLVKSNNPTTDTLGVEGSREGVTAQRKDRKKPEPTQPAGETAPAAQSPEVPGAALGP